MQRRCTYSAYFTLLVLIVLKVILCTISKEALPNGPKAQILFHKRAQRRTWLEGLCLYIVASPIQFSLMTGRSWITFTPFQFVPKWDTGKPPCTNCLCTDFIFSTPPFDEHLFSKFWCCLQLVIMKWEKYSKWPPLKPHSWWTHVLQGFGVLIQALTYCNLELTIKITQLV